MEIVLCHQTVDFDALGSAVGLARLQPGRRIVLTGGMHPAVRSFLALHRDEYPLLERRAVIHDQLRRVIVVDTQHRDRLGKAAELLDLPQLEGVEVYDHHMEATGDIPATVRHVEAVGSCTTLAVEALQRGMAQDETQSPITLSVADATVMALGIHVDTGSLTFAGTTARDGAALAWLLERGANLALIRAYANPSLSPDLQDLFIEALERVTVEREGNRAIASVALTTDGYVAGLSSLVGRLMDTLGCKALFLAAVYRQRSKSGKDSERVAIIGRSRIRGTNLSPLFESLGGGGHSQAASATVHGGDAQIVLEKLVAQLKDQIPPTLTANTVMSSPVRTILPETAIAEAQRILLRYGHSGICVVDAAGKLAGIVSRRDLDLALHHGLSHAPVKGYMSTRLHTIAPDTPLAEIERLMVTFDIGRLPVLDGKDGLLGIVTRTDMLRQFHRDRATSQDVPDDAPAPPVIDTFPAIGSPDHDFCVLLSRFASPLRRFLVAATQLASDRGWQLYLVGGAVRDLLLSDTAGPLMLSDVDLVVDGCHDQGDRGQAAAVDLGKAIQAKYPNARLQIHGQFQTAALLWHNDETFGSLWVDIATARTEFYPYPAANPEVEASSIRQDLYRRDFTINALAARLSQPHSGELLDFFGGLQDLQRRQIRVLHANSFIEDPTRIYRAVRFAVRLGFSLEPQTEGYIRHAMAQLPQTAPEIAQNNRHNSQPVRRQPALETRLKAELKYILQTSYWRGALTLLDNLGALVCIHPQLTLTASLRLQLNQVARLWERWSRSPQLAKYLPQGTELWEILLELIVAAAPEGDRQTIAQRLQLTDNAIQRLSTLGDQEKAIYTRLKNCDRPSEIDSALATEDSILLAIIALRSPRPVRRKIWQYLSHLAPTPALLNGTDLRQLGYRPGPQFRPMLAHLRQATLDGDIQNRDQAIALLQAHHPLDKAVKS
ncbi:MAG: CBS domain-containing protein [Cyanobacteria bacterium P01_D01_bin.73]